MILLAGHPVEHRLLEDYTHLEMLGYEWRLVFWLIPINVWVICETKVHHLSMFPALMLQQDLVVALIRFADLENRERKESKPKVVQQRRNREEGDIPIDIKRTRPDTRPYYLLQACNQK